MSNDKIRQNWLKMYLMRWTIIALFGLAFPSLTFAQTPSHTPPAGMTCPGDKLVWVNTRSHVYHFQGERYFGSTKDGKFMCERTAGKEGDRPTRNGQ
jgi:hypothetical protein